MPDNDIGANKVSGPGEKPAFETSTPPPKPSGLRRFFSLGTLFAILVLAAFSLTPPGRWMGHWFIATLADAVNLRTGPPAAGIEVGPLVLSAGLTDENKPARPGTVFSAEDLKNYPLALYAEFTKAVPGETVFRVRWSIGETISDSNDLHVSHSRAAIAVLCERDIPPGVHQVDLFVNGVANSSATFTVTNEPATAPSKARSTARTKIPASASTKPKTYPVEQRIVLQPDGGIAAAPMPRPVAPSLPAVSQAPPAETTKYFVTHKHRFGSCTGTLEIQGPNIVFHSGNPDEGVREFPRSTLTPMRDGFVTEFGEKWRFSIQNQDAGQVVKEWLAR